MILKAGAIRVKQRMFQIQGKRRAAWVKLTDEIIRDDKIEPGISTWSSTSLPVPKKKPNGYRLVEDFRRLNNATIDDSQPLPRFEDILQKQEILNLERIRFEGCVSSNAIEGGTPTYHLYFNSKGFISMEGASNGA
jgi:hypothetical protein